jgi:hypothetical protein
MDPVAMFSLQHGRVHSSQVSAGPSIADRVFGGVTDEQMRIRPATGLNSLVWLLWHMARVEDVGVNVVVAAAQQVLDERWAARLGVSRTDVGTGMTAAEVAAFSDAVDVAAVRAYRDAVGRRTREVVAALGDARWEERFTEADAARAPAWFTVFTGQPRALELGTAAITHNAIHLGEAITVRSLAGFPAG